MRQASSWLVILLAGAAVCIATTAATSASEIAGDIIPNSWILRLKGNAPDSAFIGFQQHFRKRALEGTVEIKHEYDMGTGSFRGFAIHGAEDVVMSFNESQWVHDIEPDRWASLPFEGFEEEATPEDQFSNDDDWSSPASDPTWNSKRRVLWNLEKVCHRGVLSSGPFAGQYRCPKGCGAGTYIYIVDTGVKSTHPQLQGRVEEGYTPCKSRIPDKRDMIGHGSHVAGTAAGKSWGVAQQATIVDVKVFCRFWPLHNGKPVKRPNLNTPNSYVLAGVNWAVKDAIAKGRTDKAVINLSLGTPIDTHQGPTSLMDAVSAAVDRGIFVAISAGNSGKAARDFSPAAEDAGCTVGAIDHDMKFWKHSNHGDAVDILAPGVRIRSISIWKASGIGAMSGTSMAAPHVAGVAATWMAAGVKVPAKDLCKLLRDAGPVHPGPRPAGTSDRMLCNGMCTET